MPRRYLVSCACQYFVSHDGRLLPQQLRETSFKIAPSEGIVMLPDLAAGMLNSTIRADAIGDEFLATVRALRNAGMAALACEILDAEGAKRGRASDFRLRLEAARTLAAVGDCDGSLAILEEMKATHPNNHHLFLAETETHVLNKNYRRALDAMRTAPLAELPPHEQEKVVFRALQIAIYMAAVDVRPRFAKPRIAPPCDSAVAVMMVRDEADIIGQNFCHHYRLGFRKFAIILNRCCDETPSIVAQFEAAHEDAIVCTISDPAECYYQAGKTQAAVGFAQTYFAAIHRPVVWCFILDADEFLCVDDDRGLGGLVTTAEGAGKDFITLHLSNATSAAGDEFARDMSVYEHFRTVVGCTVPVGTKNAFRIDIDAQIAMGNHSLYYSQLSLERAMVAAEVGARLVHLPYRSRAQIKTKIVNGAAAYGATDLDKNLGAHWRVLYTRFLQSGEDVLARHLAWYHSGTLRAAMSRAPLRFAD
jgi:hypothetical protein